MPNSTLKIIHKRFIVRSLAAYEAPSDVITSVKEIFDITVTKQQLQHYDPTTAAGKELSKVLTDLFFDTRKEFEKNEDLPIMKRIFRLKKLAYFVEQFEKMKNYKMAAAMLEQAAKESGGMFTNRKEIGGIGGGAIEVHAKSLDEWKKDSDLRTAEAAAVLEMFADD